MALERIKLTSPEADRWLQPAEGTGGIRAFNSYISGIRDRTRDLWAIRGPARGVVVTGQDAGRLFIFYLHGARLYGRIGLLAQELLTKAREQGLRGLGCRTNDVVRARLFLQVPGVYVADQDKNYFLLELNDNGRF